METINNTTTEKKHIQADVQEMLNLTEKARLAKEAEERAKEEVASYFRDHPSLYYVKVDDCYMEYHQDLNQWTKLGSTSLTVSDKRLRGKNFEIFKQMMEEFGRIKERRGYWFPTLVPPGSKKLLNEFRNDGWVKPIFERSDNTFFFDYLMMALGNDNVENIRHLKQVIGWKYTNPHDVLLPCLCFYGQGGVGKNLLVDVILQCVFGPGSTNSLMFSQADKFNSALAGAMVINYNESAYGNVKIESLKNTVGSVTLNIERKGMDIVKVPNSALYICSTNDSNGAFKLENNESDRRWSILKVTTSLKSIMMREEKIDEAAATELIKHLADTVYNDPNEVARFLGECVTEANLLTSTPNALHGEDYDTLKEIQAGAEEDVVKEVFVDDVDFEYITFQTLYTLYVQRLRETNPAAKPKSIQRFCSFVEEYLRHHKIPATRHPDRKQITGKGKQRIFCVNSLIVDGKRIQLKDNEKYYINYEYLMTKEEKVSRGTGSEKLQAALAEKKMKLDI